MKDSIKTSKVSEFLAVFQEEKKGGFSVWVPELPGCASQGESFDEALINIREAVELYLQSDNLSLKYQNHDYKKQFTVPVKLSYA